MKKTMIRILLLAAAMVLALSLCLAHAEEVPAGEEAAVSTPAYIFWQDEDWWPAASNKTDDYWTPIPANVTGEGYYTVGVTAHMPSWFYSGGNHNRGAQKLAVIVTDGATLFPNMYMQIIDVRIDGVSYGCGDVTYGQTGYDNVNGDDGTVFWDADDSYALLYDQWMIDNAGTIGTGSTWNSSAAAQKFDVFDVSVLDDPTTIEIDFFLSSAQDVKPAGGPALRTINEGPKTASVIATPSNAEGEPEVSTKAYIFWQDEDWWPAASGNMDDYWTPNKATITGEGHYTVGLDAHMPDWFYPGDNHNRGAQKLAIIIEDGTTTFPGMYMQITDVRIDGVSYNVGDVTYGQTGYDNINGDDGTVYWDANDTYGLLYDSYMANPDNNGSIWGGVTWDSSATAQNFNIFDVSNFDDPKSIEIDFFLSYEQDVIPEIKVEEKPVWDRTWYPNNTMSVAGLSLRDRGVTDKWYNVVPVDLTKDGYQSFPMIASNMYVMGDAIVTVNGDDVSVSYQLPNHTPGAINVESECIKWFSSLEEITDEFCDNPASDIAFGDVVNKADIGDVGYLFICNRVTYCQPIVSFTGISLPRYWINSPEWRAYRASLEMLVEVQPAE